MKKNLDKNSYLKKNIYGLFFMEQAMCIEDKMVQR